MGKITSEALTGETRRVVHSVLVMNDENNSDWIFQVYEILRRGKQHNASGFNNSLYWQ